MNVRFLEAASQDVEDIAAYIADRNERAGRRFPTAVARTVELLVQFPGAGTATQIQPISNTTLRRFVVKGFRRYIVYYYSNSELVIVRVLHGARDRDTILRRNL